MKKNVWVILGIVLIIAVIAFGFLNSSAPHFSNANVVSIDYANMEEELPKLPIVQSLGHSAVVQLKFYNFDTGQRQWENSYVIEGDSVKKGIANNPDVTVIMSSKYLKELTNQDYCSVIKKANQNGDLGMEYGLSKLMLLVRYGNMLKYKECF